MRIPALPYERVEREPLGACISDSSCSLTNVDFAAAVISMAARLSRSGVGRGDVVAAVLSNRVELVVTMFAAWRVGAALTPVNPVLTAAEAQLQITDSGAKVLVAERAAPSQGVAIIDVDDVLTPGEPNGSEGSGPEPDDLALVIYTSGSTGRPKGVMLDHANVSATATMLVDWFGLSAADRCLLVLPLFHVNGIMASVVAPLAAGGSTVIADRFNPTTFWEQVERVRPSYFSAVPTMYSMLAAQQTETEPDTSSLRHVICGAAPMPAELIVQFESRFGVPVVEGYGLSECTIACTANPPLGNRRPGTVGLVLPGQEVEVVDEQDHSLPAGQRGEVVVRGPNVMRGYLGMPEETARTLRGGWLHTGDVGVFDEDGYLTLVDRIKDLIIRGGENISPSEIEQMLYAHEAVLEAAVVARPSEVYGEEPVAFVALRPGKYVDADDLIEHCRRNLARFKVPRAVFIVPTLPKNAIGKISKPALRERLQIDTSVRSR
jgi:acyl-CoA synthetase (AMP-forming)/AMP-acid ligase II